MKRFYESRSNRVIIRTERVILRKSGAHARRFKPYSYQGKGNVGALMKDLEEELRTRGVKWITRDSAVENGYADKIQKHYGERVVETRERMSPWGKQRHFKIEL